MSMQFFPVSIWKGWWVGVKSRKRFGFCMSLLMIKLRLINQPPVTYPPHLDLAPRPFTITVRTPSVNHTVWGKTTKKKTTKNLRPEHFEPKNEGLEDDVPFQTGDFQVLRASSFLSLPRRACTPSPRWPSPRPFASGTMDPSNHATGAPGTSVLTVEGAGTSVPSVGPYQLWMGL